MVVGVLVSTLVVEILFVDAVAVVTFIVVCVFVDVVVNSVAVETMIVAQQRKYLPTFPLDRIISMSNKCYNMKF